jgi:hypothetical protein
MEIWQKNCEFCPIGTKAFECRWDIVPGDSAPFDRHVTAEPDPSNPVGLFATSHTQLLLTSRDALELVALGPGEGSRSFPCLVLIHLPGNRGASGIIVPIKK